MNAQTLKNSPIVIDSKGDASLADDHNAAQRASIINAIELADGNMSQALLLALKMTVSLGATSKAEVEGAWPRCNNPGVYASWFNVGHKAQAVMGQKLALETIEKAAATKGQAFQNAIAALQSVIKEAKAQGVKELKPAAAKMAAKAAVTKVSAPKLKAPATENKRGPKLQDAATLAAAAVSSGAGARELAAFVLLCSNNAHRMAAPEGREEAHRLAVKKLEEAAEAWSVFRK